MGQMPCESCGQIISDTSRFCSRCGSSIPSWTPPSAVDQSAPPTYQQQSPYQQPPYQQQPYQQPPYPQQSYQQSPYPQQNYQQQQSPLVPQGYGFAPAPMPAYVERKDKTAAILLAVFLGFWTWLYTYKKDAWKFWLCLGLNITVFNPLWTWILLFLPNIALHIWSIVDTVGKPQQYYDYYPNT
ncbi:MAG TPA: zinc ribbon domain-containing protein [Blastocatellia bacterium]|nr:zinc ribbon domain-containing protein [Blastocatellia bacterium]